MNFVDSYKGVNVKGGLLFANKTGLRLKQVLNDGWSVFIPNAYLFYEGA